MKTEKGEVKTGILESFKLLWKYMGTKERITFVLIFILSTVSAFTQMYCAILPAIIVSWFSGEGLGVFSFLNTLNISTAAYLLIVCGIASLLWLFGMLIYRMIDIFGRHMVCVVNEKAQHIILLERKNLDFGMTVGETEYIVKSAVDNIYNIIEPFCWNFCTNFVCALYMLIQLFSIDIYVGLVALGLVILILIGVVVRTKTQKRVVENIEETNAKIGNHFLQSLTNLPMITIFQSKKRELEELKKLNSDFFKQNKKRANIGFWYWTLIITIEYMGLAALLAVFLSVNKGTNIIASITIIISELISIYSMVENWGYLLSDLQSASIKFCNLKKIYPQGKLESEDSPQNSKMSERIKSLELVDLTISLTNFKKSYSLSFEAGKVYLISGQSGKGKTTLINAICGLRDANSGHLIVNKTLECKSLYVYKDHISYLFQDSILFDRSIEENIAYPETSLSLEARRLTNRFGLEKLLSRDTGGNVAASLSGGEKKRIDIVRTFSKDKDIYLLDEPTNELDAENVQIVLEEIQTLAKAGKIVIVISHDERLKIIADSIIDL